MLSKKNFGFALIAAATTLTYVACAPVRHAKASAAAAAGGAPLTGLPLKAAPSSSPLPDFSKDIKAGDSLHLKLAISGDKLADHYSIVLCSVPAAAPAAKVAGAEELVAVVAPAPSPSASASAPIAESCVPATKYEVDCSAGECSDPAKRLDVSVDSKGHAGYMVIEIKDSKEMLSCAKAQVEAFSAPKDDGGVAVDAKAVTCLN